MRPPGQDGALEQHARSAGLFALVCQRALSSCCSPPASAFRSTRARPGRTTPPFWKETALALGPSRHSRGRYEALTVIEGGDAKKISATATPIHGLLMAHEVRGSTALTRSANCPNAPLYSTVMNATVACTPGITALTTDDRSSVQALYP